MANLWIYRIIRYCTDELLVLTNVNGHTGNKKIVGVIYDSPSSNHTRLTKAAEEVLDNITLDCQNLTLVLGMLV